MAPGVTVSVVVVTMAAAVFTPLAAGEEVGSAALLDDSLGGGSNT